MKSPTPLVSLSWTPVLGFEVSDGVLFIFLLHDKVEELFFIAVPEQVSKQFSPARC